MIDKELSPEKAIERAQFLCARQERCSDDIRKKLVQWKVPVSSIDLIIKKLVADGFLNDERFALMFARDKSKFNKWGPHKISYALKAKHFSEETIKKALGEIELSMDQSSLVEILTKKAKSVKSKSPYDLKVKLIRFGLSRGFEYEQVNKAVALIFRGDL